MKLPDFKADLFSRKSGATSPKVKAPKLLRDLYADLRDRGLIPLAILLIVAIAAVPFVLGNQDGEEEPVAVTPPTTQPASTNSGFTVVPAARKLRAYGKRLGYRTPRDPFSAGGGNGGEGSESAAQSSGGAAGSSEGSEGGIRVETITRTITKQPKVVKARIKAEVGVAAVLKAGYVGSEPQSLEVEDQTKLPPNSPAIVYTGTSKKGGALFLMTTQVSEFTGDGRCVLGGAICQVVELQPKSSETFRIGYDETRYKVQLLGFESVVREGVVEYEGKKMRFPGKEKNGRKSKAAGNGQGSVGNAPLPRSLTKELLPEGWQQP